MHPSLLAAHGRSMALRSEQVLLSCPSSLQGHSDFPSARNARLAGVTQLDLRLLPPDRDRNRGISGPPSRSLSPHAAGLTPGPPQVRLPFSSLWAMAFPQQVEGRRLSPFSRGLSHSRTLPAISIRVLITRLHHSSSYCGLRFWLAPLTGYDSFRSLRGTVSGQVPPRCCHPNAPPAYIPPKATGMAVSFHPAS